MAKKLAYKFNIGREHVDDLTQDALLYVIESHDRWFDPTKGKWEYMARVYARNGILRTIMNYGSPVRVPMSTWEKADRNIKGLGSDATYEEIIASGVDKNLALMRHKRFKSATADETILNTVPQEHKEVLLPILSRITQRNMRRFLTPTETEVMSFCFALYGSASSIQELCKETGISNFQFTRNRTRAIKTLRRIRERSTTTKK